MLSSGSWRAARAATALIACARNNVSIHRIPTVVQQQYASFHCATAMCAPAGKIAKVNVPNKAAALMTAERVAPHSGTTIPVDSTKRELFQNATSLSTENRKAIAQQFKFTTMTPIQNAVLLGHTPTNDLLVRAGTGMGKTLAFLVSAVEAVRLKHSQNAFRGRGPTIIVVAPTREIALQITGEAKKLCTEQGISVVSAVGGTSYNHRALERAKIGILVCTPGRLKDLLEQGIASMDVRARDVDVLVLDEADRLLDLGLEHDIRSIMGYLNPNRTTYMFSSTFSRDIYSTASLLLKKGYSHVDSVLPKEASTEVMPKQEYSIVPLENYFTHLYELLAHEKKIMPDNYKVMVFINSINLCSFMADIFLATKEFYKDIEVLHSKQSNQERKMVVDAFRNSKRGILFTTDVSARGVDYHDISLVVNCGIPSSFDAYIHRVSRTSPDVSIGSRAVTILSQQEKPFIDVLQRMDVPITPLSKEIPFTSAEAAEELDPNSVPQGLRKFIISSVLGSNLQAFTIANIPTETVLAHAKEFSQKVLKVDKPTLTAKVARNFPDSALGGFAIAGDERPATSPFKESSKPSKLSIFERPSTV